VLILSFCLAVFLSFVFRLVFLPPELGGPRLGGFASLPVNFDRTGFPPSPLLCVHLESELGRPFTLFNPSSHLRTALLNLLSCAL